MFVTTQKLHDLLLQMRDYVKRHYPDVDSQWIVIKQFAINALYRNLVDHSFTFFCSLEDPKNIEQHILNVNFKYETTIIDLAHGFAVACDTDAFNEKGNAFLGCVALNTIKTLYVFPPSYNLSAGYNLL